MDLTTRIAVIVYSICVVFAIAQLVVYCVRRHRYDKRVFKRVFTDWKIIPIIALAPVVVSYWLVDEFLEWYQKRDSYYGG